MFYYANVNKIHEPQPARYCCADAVSSGASNQGNNDSYWAQDRCETSLKS